MPDGMMAGFGHNGGPPMSRGMFTFDGITMDSAGAFLLGELERLDPIMHAPLVAYTWTRDVDLREDITVGDEWSSFYNSSYGHVGGLTPAGISWAGKNSNAIAGPSLDIGKTAQPLRIWASEVSWTVQELVSAMQISRPIDDQKFQVMRLKYQMDMDQLTYIGDPLLGVGGLVNHPSVTNATNVTGGAWATDPDVVIAQISEFVTSVWETSGFAYVPTELRVPPAQFAKLASMKVSSAGNISLLRYLQENTIANTQMSQPLNIQPVKWLKDRGATASQRMVAYTKAYENVRLPVTALQRTPLENRSLYQLTTYWGRAGQIEIPYPEAIGYRDGI